MKPQKIFFVVAAASLFTACDQTRFSKTQNFTDSSMQPAACLMPPDVSAEEYANIHENEFHKAKDEPLSTFSIDVDRASYSNVRRFLHDGQMPQADAVRIEEMVNYFTYDYPNPESDVPFSVTTETGTCPWNSKHQLVLIGLQGKKIEVGKIPASNLVFLIDVSGSMDSPDKLPLLKQSFKILADQLRPQDKVSIVVYAGSAGLVLPSTSGNEKTKIKDAIDAMDAGGSTAGSEGIKLAYNIAKENFIIGGNNRVILATDGDFNVGVTSEGELEELITARRSQGIYLTVLGFGTGNIKDSKMELLADKGNGNYAYIDNLLEGKKIFMNEFGATLFTIAKDVKLQVEFNPSRVSSYRLIGYENRVLAKEDFNDDKKDAGEIGAGHTVTALYEIIQAASEEDASKVDALKYQQTEVNTIAQTSNDMMTIKIRYKLPNEETSQRIEHVVRADQFQNENSDNFRFASSVAEFGLLLRESQFKADAKYEQVLKSANSCLENDEEGYRHEFVKMVETAQLLAINQVSKE